MVLAAIKMNYIKSRAKPNTPHLIVVPPSLLFNWHLEIDKFFPFFNIYEYSGSNRQTNFEDYDIVLITYDLVRRDIKRLSKKKFDVIIFDEAQMIKNIQAARSIAVKEIKGQFKICLTGTPLENHLGEYYSIGSDNRDLNYAPYFSEGKKSEVPSSEYNSDNTERLDVAKMKDLLMQLPEIKNDPLIKL